LVLIPILAANLTQERLPLGLEASRLFLQPMGTRIFIWLRRIGRWMADLVADYSFYFRPKRRRQQVFIREVLSNPAALPSSRIIVSLSTLPDRIGRLRPTLEALLSQTSLPDEIVLAVPRFSIRQNRGYTIPSYLSQVPRLRLLPCDNDWGPATKFIAVVQDELAAGRNHTLIMVVDDDRIYPSNSIELYRHYSAKLPDAALCFRGGPIPPSLNWRDKKMEFGVDLHSPKRTAVMTGCGSYLIQPRFFDSSLWDYSDAPDGAFYMDDIWISGCLERNGVEKYIIPASDMMRTSLRQLGTMTLHDVPNGRQHNNDETIEFFSANWKIFGPR
jgi:hypothetical protein